MKSKKIKNIKLDENNFSQELIDAFAACSESGWADKEYALYQEEVKKLLGKAYDDPIESGRLIVLLSRTKSSKPNGKKEKVKAKKDKKPARNKCTLSESGSDEGQEERQENAETLEAEG